MCAAPLDDVKMGDTLTPYIAAADGALRAAGLWDDDVDMLMGLTGLGFHLVVDPGTCPSSPTAYGWTRAHTDAMRRIGVASTCVECLRDPDAFEVRRDEAVGLIKDSLDRGVPAVVRTFDWAEFAIVTGYDDEDGVLFMADFTGAADPVLYQNLGKPHGFPFLFAQVFGEREGFDLERACSQSLEYAVVCWRGDGFPKHPMYSSYPVGARGYETLIGAVERADTDPLGLRYILKIHADARARIARYTRRVSEQGVLPGLEPVAESYGQAAPALARVTSLLPAAPPWERPLDPEVLPEAARLLRTAAELEERAVGAIEKALVG